MREMPSSSSFLRQLSGKSEAWKSTSKRWGGGHSKCRSGGNTNMGFGFGQNCEGSLNQMEGLNNMYGFGNENGGLVMRKRVMVVVDESSHSKHAMIWALTHVANKGDLLTLLHVVPSSHKVVPSERASADSASSSSSSSSSSFLANSLGSLCKACKPEVEVEALVIQGPKLATVISQVKKLEVSVLVLGQKKTSPLISCLCGMSRTEEFVEQCINGADCLTIGVRKQSKGVSGYLISTKWQKDFWLLA
ncbi:Universal stress protein [Parasponia andersonii]|uniref:Universal stress protein n=1 Tax=Parasponia andersonii TaxID=3476 RepID=A0A2P5BE19_PARAD|nr:Universal stress protein [Parasponia andersonii]